MRPAVRAFLLSPLMVAPVVAAGALIVGRGAPTAWTWILNALILAIPASYAISLLVGLPSVWLLRRLGTLHVVPLALGAVSVGALTGFLAARWLLAPVNYVPNHVGIIAFTVMGAASGLAVALVHRWLAGVRPPPSRPADPVDPPRTPTPGWIIVARCCWIVACGALLARCYISSQCSDVQVVVPILAMGFPASIALVVLIAFASTFIGRSTFTPLEATVITWMLASAAGYLQWFVLLPKVIRDHKRYREAQSAQPTASARRGRKWYWILLAAWILGCLALLLRCFFAPSCGDAEVLYPIVVFGFPASTAAAVVVAGVSGFTLHGTVLTAGTGWLVGSWLAVSVAGYLQWFVVLPWLVRAFRRRRDRKRGDASPG